MFAPLMDKLLSGKYNSRTALLVGEENMAELSRTKAIIFGVGGVGSWCAEGLIRNGIGHLTIVDPDLVAESNVNRQLMATSKTVGKVKVDVLKERLLEINPDAEIKAIRSVYSKETANSFDLDSFDFVIDCIDSLKDKADLILSAASSKATFLSSMGAALKMDPTKVRVAGFWEVRGCPLGAALRKKFRKNGTLPEKDFLCVFDDEVLENKGDGALTQNEPMNGKAVINGSLVHITAIFGFTLAGLVTKMACKEG